MAQNSFKKGRFFFFKSTVLGTKQPKSQKQSKRQLTLSLTIILCIMLWCICPNKLGQQCGRHFPLSSTLRTMHQAPCHLHHSLGVRAAPGEAGAGRGAGGRRRVAGSRVSPVWQSCGPVNGPFIGVPHTWLHVPGLREFYLVRYLVRYLVPGTWYLDSDGCRTAALKCIALK
jgi:hypothetical protein